MWHWDSLFTFGIFIVIMKKGKESEEGLQYNACPTCKRPVALGTDKCSGCGQALGWTNIKKADAAKGSKTARLEFEVPSDFTPGDCRKCPLSYIAKEGGENVYECPLKMRTLCKLELS